MRRYESFIMEKEAVYSDLNNEYVVVKQKFKFLNWIQNKLIKLMKKIKLIENRQLTSLNFNRVTIDCESVMNLVYKTLDHEMYCNMLEGRNFKIVMGYEYFGQLRIEPGAQYRIKQEVKINGDRGLYVDNIEIILTPRIDGMFLLED